MAGTSPHRGGHPGASAASSQRGRGSFSSTRGRGRGTIPSSTSRNSTSRSGGSRGRHCSSFSRGVSHRGRAACVGGRGGNSSSSPCSRRRPNAASASFCPSPSAPCIASEAEGAEAFATAAPASPGLESSVSAAPVAAFSSPEAEALLRQCRPLSWLSKWDRLPWFAALKKVESEVLVLPLAPAAAGGSEPSSEKDEEAREAFFAYFFLLGERLLLQLSEEYEALLSEDSEQRWFLQLAREPVAASATAARVVRPGKKEQRRRRDAAEDAFAGTEFAAEPTKGTRGDALSALSLLIQQQPLCACKWLHKLLYMISGKKEAVGGRRTWGRNCQSAVEAAFSLFDGPSILPAFRKLRYLAQQPQYLRDRVWAFWGRSGDRAQPTPAAEKPTDKKEKKKEKKAQEGEGDEPREVALLQLAMLWRLEAEFKVIYANFVQLLADGVSDSVLHFARRSLRLAWSLLMRKKEEEQKLLSLLVRSLGSRETQVASSASHLLAQLLVRHAPMKQVVVVFVGNFLLANLHEALSRAAAAAEKTWEAVRLASSAQTRKKEKRRRRRLLERGLDAEGETAAGLGTTTKEKEKKEKANNKRVELLGRLVTRLLRSGCQWPQTRAKTRDNVARQERHPAADAEEDRREEAEEEQEGDPQRQAGTAFANRMIRGKTKRMRPLPAIEVKSLQMQILTLLMPAKLPDFLQGVYRAVLFFSELQFHKDTDGEVAAHVTRVYLQVFTQLHRFPASLRARLSRTRPTSAKDSAAIPCPSVPPLYTLASLNRLTRALLNGMHRALPYLPVESFSSPLSAALRETKEPQKIDAGSTPSPTDDAAEMLETLFALAHTLPSMASRIVVLRLLHRLTETANGASDRLSRVVYEHLNDPSVFAASNRSALLSLVCSLVLPDSPLSLKDSLSLARTVAVCKRVLQVSLAHADLPGVTAAAAVIASLLVARAKRAAKTGKKGLSAKKSRVEQLLSETEDNLITDENSNALALADENAKEKGKNNKNRRDEADSSDLASTSPCVYDPTKRDPRYSRASQSRLWELAAASAFYHPAVSALACSTIDACSSLPRGTTVSSDSQERPRKRPKVDLAFDEDSVVALSTTLTHSRVLDLLAYKPRAEWGRETEKGREKKQGEAEMQRAKSPFALGRAAAFPLDSARHWVARGEKIPPQEEFMSLYFQDPFIAESEKLRQKKRKLGDRTSDEGSDEERVDESDEEKQDQLLSDEEVDNFLTEQLAAQFGADAPSDEEDFEDDGFGDLEDEVDGEDGEAKDEAEEDDVEGDEEVDWDALSSGDEEMEDAIFGGDEGDVEEESDRGGSRTTGGKRKSSANGLRAAHLERLRAHVKKHSKLGEPGGSFVSAEGLEDLLKG
ncbi:CBF/Mak21 family protein [Toxoplasma gondii MAS]|uniref:CBF/Mak21 family protein n=1 Tax=Toxoplasma gondii MAS TaxID=943118 RepID=A0A086QYN5_TOXGO|nr:CBF/Mak21 family protein [Toxoplasma gondii MAS]